MILIILCTTYHTPMDRLRRLIWPDLMLMDPYRPDNSPCPVIRYRLIVPGRLVLTPTTHEDHRQLILTTQTRQIELATRHPVTLKPGPIPRLWHA